MICCLKINDCVMLVYVRGCMIRLWPMIPCSIRYKALTGITYVSSYLLILHVRFVSGYRQRLGHDLLCKDKWLFYVYLCSWMHKNKGICIGKD